MECERQKEYTDERPDAFLFLLVNVVNQQFTCAVHLPLKVKIMLLVISVPLSRRDQTTRPFMMILSCKMHAGNRLTRYLSQACLPATLGEPATSPCPANMHQLTKTMQVNQTYSNLL